MQAFGHKEEEEPRTGPVHDVSRTQLNAQKVLKRRCEGGQRKKPTRYNNDRSRNPSTTKRSYTHTSNSKLVSPLLWIRMWELSGRERKDRSVAGSMAARRSIFPALTGIPLFVKFQPASFNLICSLVAFSRLTLCFLVRGPRSRLTLRLPLPAPELLDVYG
jgi:hypothetical protein